jgi:6-phosphogluconolactonase (cycloisomerase 2 family)
MAGLLRVDKTKTEVADSVAGHGDALVVAPNGRFAYTLNTIEGSVTSYVIDSAQLQMTAISGGVVKTGAEPTDMSIDVNGWYLYVTNSGDASLSVYYLNPTSGIPEPVRGSPVPTGKRPGAITLDAAARYAFVVNAGSNNVSVYRYLNNVTPVMFEGRKYGSPFAAGQEPVALALEPTGHYAYVANAGSNDISAYHVHNKTGLMSAIPGSPFKAGKRPVDLKVHPKGRWLYVANQDSSTLTIHRIEAGLGALAEEVKTVALPVQPMGIWFDESDNSLLVLGKDRRRVLRYSVNDQSGTIDLLSDKHFAQPVNDFAFMPASQR